MNSAVESTNLEPTDLEDGRDLNAQIIDVSKHVSNYETFVSYEIECVVGERFYFVIDLG